MEKPPTHMDIVHHAIILLQNKVQFEWIYEEPTTPKAKRTLVSPYWKSWECEGKQYFLLPENKNQVTLNDITDIKENFDKINEKILENKIKEISEALLEINMHITALPNTIHGDNRVTGAITSYICKRYRLLPSQLIWDLIIQFHEGAYIIQSTKKAKLGYNPFNNQFMISKNGNVEEGCYNCCIQQYIVSNKEENPPTKEEPKAIFPYQRKIYQEVEETYLDFKFQSEQTLAIQPRWHRLLIGRTGTGKTHIAKALAYNNQQPLLYINANNWIPLGARLQSGVTWIKIINFIEENKSGIIFIDEIDKINSIDHWTTHLRMEIFSILDQSIPMGAIKPLEEDEQNTNSQDQNKITQLEKKLKEKFFILSAGAFQNTIEEIHRNQMGFKTPEKSEPNISHQDLAKTLPRELVNRFGEILHLPFPNKKDYEQMIETTEDLLPKDTLPHFQKAVGELLPSAIENQMGTRMLEVALSQAIRQKRREMNKILQAKTITITPKMKSTKKLCATQDLD